MKRITDILHIKPQDTETAIPDVSNNGVCCHQLYGLVSQVASNIFSVLQQAFLFQHIQHCETDSAGHWVTTILKNKSHTGLPPNWKTRVTQGYSHTEKQESHRVTTILKNKSHTGLPLYRKIRVTPGYHQTEKHESHRVTTKLKNMRHTGLPPYKKTTQSQVKCPTHSEFATWYCGNRNYYSVVMMTG